MAREFSRTVRIAENIKRALAPRVDTLVRDTGLGMASITEVEVSPDLGRARVFISLYCDKAQRGVAIDMLNARAGQLRHQLASGVRIKKMPVLQFELDNSIERGVRIAQLIGGGPDGTLDK